MIRHLMTASSALLLGGLLLVSPTTAQENEGKKGKAPLKKQPDQQQQIPQYLESLDLTQEQRSQIRDITGEYQDRINSKWKDFHRMHWECIQLEAALLAAADSSGEKNAADAKDESRDKKDISRDEPKSTSGDKPKDTSRGKKKGDEQTKSPQKKMARDEMDFDIMVMRVLVRRPDGQLREYYLFKDLDDDQAKGPDREGRAFMKDYQSRLRRQWQRVHKLHDELVRLQAREMQAITEVLTEEQQEKLHASARKESDTATEDTDKRPRE